MVHTVKAGLDDVLSGYDNVEAKGACFYPQCRFYRITAILRYIGLGENGSTKIPKNTGINTIRFSTEYVSFTYFAILSKLLFFSGLIIHCTFLPVD